MNDEAEKKEFNQIELYIDRILSVIRSVVMHNDEICFILVCYEIEKDQLSLMSFFI